MARSIKSADTRWAFTQFRVRSRLYQRDSSKKGALTVAAGPRGPNPVHSRCKPGGSPVVTGVGPGLHRVCTGFASDEVTAASASGTARKNDGSRRNQTKAAVAGSTPDWVPNFNVPEGY